MYNPETGLNNILTTRHDLLSKNYLQLTNEMVRDQFLTPMGMLYALIVKHESIVEWWELPILKKTIVEWGPA